MKAFEIHTFKDGQWVTDSVFDDRDLALHEARKVEEAGRYSSLRVIEEDYDEVSDYTTTRTIFRGGKTQQIVKDRRNVPSKPSSAKPRGGAGKEPVRKSRPANNEKKKTNLLVPILILIVLVVAGAASLFAMQYYGVQN